MTVAQLIKQLLGMKDKQLRLMIDCPHCGKANELKTVNELVVLGSKKASA